MVVEKAAIVGPGCAGCCTVLSIFGVVFLFLIGLAFQNNVHVLMGSNSSPKDGGKVAEMCYIAAMVYAGFVVFCGCQLGVNRRTVRGGEVRL